MRTILENTNQKVIHLSCVIKVVSSATGVKCNKTNWTALTHFINNCNISKTNNSVSIICLAHVQKIHQNSIGNILICIYVVNTWNTEKFVSSFVCLLKYKYYTSFEELTVIGNLRYNICVVNYLNAKLCETAINFIVGL